MRGAVAVDTMLLALAAHPDACRSSGFSTGLLRAAIVASELHPCSPQERVDYDHAAGRAVPTISTTAVDNARDADGSALPLLSRRAIELLLSARPGGISASVDGLMREVCGTIGVAGSAPRTCMGFSELARREDVQAWCRGGWFVLRDLSLPLAYLRNKRRGR